MFGKGSTESELGHFENRFSLLNTLGIMMTAQKMSAQEIIAFIGNAVKKTNVKVTFEGELVGPVPAEVIKLGNVLFGDWKTSSRLFG